MVETTLKIIQESLEDVWKKKYEEMEESLEFSIIGSDGRTRVSLMRLFKKAIICKHD